MCSGGNGTSKSFRRFAFRQALARLDDITFIPGCGWGSLAVLYKLDQHYVPIRYGCLGIHMEYALGYSQYSNGCRRELEGAVELNVTVLGL